MKNSQAYKRMIEDGICVADSNGDITKWSAVEGVLFWDGDEQEWVGCEYSLFSEDEPFLECPDPEKYISLGSLDELKDLSGAYFHGERVHKEDGDWYDCDGNLLEDRFSLKNILITKNWRLIE